MVSAGVGRSAAATGGIALRGLRRASICQLWSWGAVGRAGRANVPTPGRLSIRPCAVRMRSAFCTVTGLTR